MPQSIDAQAFCAHRVFFPPASNSGKQAIALKCLAAAHETGNGLLCYQVVREWFNVVLRKAARPLNPDEAGFLYRKLIEPLWRIQSSRELIDTALDIHRRDSFSWWDALIVSAAVQGGCNQILSEDLQHGTEIRGVRIQNPF